MIYNLFARMHTPIKKQTILPVLFTLICAPFFCFAQITPPAPDYLDLIQQRVYSFLVYPNEAIANGWEGIVTLRFVIEPAGNVKQIYVTESSGFPVLDEKAVEAVRNASPFPSLEDSGDAVEVILPLQYSIDSFTLAPQEEPPALPDFSLPLANELTMAEVMEETPAAIEELDLQALPQEEQGLPTAPAAAPEQAAVAAERSALPPTQPMPAVPQPTAPLSGQQQPAKKTISKVPSVPEFNLDDLATKWHPELRAFIEEAIKKNKPGQVAKREVDLADTKVKEAVRNFFPTAKVSGYYTKGEAALAEYYEREIKLEATQPLYTGGRLLDSLEHAKVNLEITRRNYDRIRSEIIHKTETAYYNLIASKTHWRYKEALRNEAKDLLDQIEKLGEIGMIIPLELKNARATFEQFEFQLASLKQDIYLSELTFKQVLNTAELPQITLTEPAVTKPNLDLDELFVIALKKRPEVYIGELTVKFNKYAKRIEMDKDKFQVDLVGSYGYYQGRYLTESRWKKSNNTSVGLKVTKPLGANTYRGAVTNEKTEPRYGMTTVSKNRSVSSELGILDNFQGVTAKQKADIDLQRAVSDLNETKKTVSFEVQDAYLNYQKAILQLNTAETDMIYRRNQTEIIKIRAMVNDAPLSSAMEALQNLSEAQTKYYQALGNYFLSLANLKKAVAYGINI